jgi:hypothetical protein
MMTAFPPGETLTENITVQNEKFLRSGPACSFALVALPEPLRIA